MKTSVQRNAVNDEDEIAEITLLEPEENFVGQSLEDKIRERAYELYEQRGRQSGYAEEDWLRAEAEILGGSPALPER